MVKTELCRKIIDLSGDASRTLIYSLVSKKSNEPGDPEQYGISILMEETGEEALVKDISPNREEILKLIDLVATNFVTPVSLYDVVYDYLCK